MRSAVPQRRVVAGATDPGRAMDLARSKRPPPRRLLRKSDLEDKLLITRTTGRQFGTVGEAWVEPRRLNVQSFDVCTKSVPLRPERRGTVGLRDIREVGDVVLIHSDQDFSSRLTEPGLDLVSLPGLRLTLDNGRAIGRCVDFVFDPETGRIIRLIFHTVNLQFARRAWFDQYAVSVQSISRIVLSERMVCLRNDAEWKRVAVGEYQFLANLMPTFEDDWQEERQEDRRLELEGRTDLQEQYQALLAETRRQQAAYSAQYDERPAPKLRRSRPPRIDDWIKREERQLEREAFMQE